MHPGQITALTAALAATMITLVAYMSLMSSDPSKTFIKSTWHLTVNDDESESGEGTPQTWYINTADNVIKIVEHDEESESIIVQEIHAGGVYDYSTADPNMDLTVSAEACEDVDLADYDGDCESYQAEIQSDIEALSKLEIKDECSETLLTDETISFAETLPCNGNAEVGGFTVSFAECTPVAILDKESGNIVATIDSIEDGIDESVTFTKCQDDSVDITDDEDAARKLLGGQLMYFIEFLGTGTDWCGGTTLLRNIGNPCPGPKNMHRHGDFDANQACRRHDHGIVGAPSGMKLPKLECQVDKDLVSRTNNWAVHAVFGHSGLARFTGCLNYKENKRGKWTFSWTSGWTYQRRGWEWATRRGKKRMKRGNNDRSTMGHLIPTATIPHPRQETFQEQQFEDVLRWHTSQENSYMWNKFGEKRLPEGEIRPYYYAQVPRDKIYKDRFIICGNDDAPQRSIENDICWNCHSPHNWGP